MSETLLRDIAEYCRGARMAELTFGRLAVNDGKLVNRLRLGGRVTTDTVDRVRAFIAREPHGNGTERWFASRPLCRSPPPRAPPRTSAFTTTGRNTCCSSPPAARNG